MRHEFKIARTRDRETQWGLRKEFLEQSLKRTNGKTMSEWHVVLEKEIMSVNIIAPVVKRQHQDLPSSEYKGFEPATLRC